MAVAKHRSALMTAEALAASTVPEKFVELIEGELIAMTPAGHRHNRVGMNVAFLFRQFCGQQTELDYCGDNNGFLIGRDPDTVLSPDACLFRVRPDTGSTWMEFAPEVVVEVISPANSKAEMAYKRQRFFQAGSEQFWLVDCEVQTVQVYFNDGRSATHEGDAVFACEGTAFGLSVALREVFRQR